MNQKKLENFRKIGENILNNYFLGKQQAQKQKGATIHNAACDDLLED